MPSLRRVRRLVRAVLRRPDLEAEMDAEMRHHLELETEELMRGGVPEAEARRQAALAFGGVQQRKEEALEDAGLWWLDDLRRDVRIATRTLLRQPTFAITATLALALAIAVNTTMYSVLDAMINPTVGASKPEQLYAIRYFGHFGRRLGYYAPDRALGTSGKTYSGVTGSAGYANTGIVERGDESRRADILYVRANFFEVLGIAPLEGTLSPPADPVAASASVIISHRLRAQLFRDDESPVGQSIDVDGTTFRIIGVVRQYSASGALNNDVWMRPPPGRELMAGLVRLRDGVTQQQAERELAILASRIALGEDEKTSDARFALNPITQQFHVERFHYALIGAGIAILLVACTNLANLQLARGLGRASELAMRSALGASRRQIVMQLLIESAVLAVAAMVLAVLLAIAGNAAIHATIPPNIGGYVVEPQTSWRMVVFAAVAAVASLMIVGFAPAVRVSRVDLNTLLKSRAGTGAHRSNRRIYGTLVITQIALTLPLVCAAVLLSRAAIRLGSPEYRKEDQFGFDTRPIIYVSYVLPASDTTVRIGDLAARLVGMARAVPGVENAAAQEWADLDKGTIAMDDNDGNVRQISAPGRGYSMVSPSYFRTMGLPMERGHDFPEGGHAEPIVVMDRGTGWYLWPRSAPIGRSVKLGDSHSDLPWMKVVGIVGDSLNEDARQMRRMIDTLQVGNVYRVLTVTDSLLPSKYPRNIQIVVRASSDPVRVASRLRRAFRGAESVRPPQVMSFDDRRGIPERVAVLEFIAGLFTTLGVVALGLSALGVYGIVAQSVTDRKREVAVRIALGATPRNIIRTLIREGNVLVLAGVAIGLYTTKETIGWLGSFLGDVDVANALLFGALCVALFCAMVLSALVPAFRATKLDPMEVLRAE